MSDIEFKKEDKELIINKIQNYFLEELDQELGRFDVEFFMEFLSKEIGGYYYNQGLYDAQKVLEEKLENLKDDLFGLEKPTDFAR